MYHIYRLYTSQYIFPNILILLEKFDETSINFKANFLSLKSAISVSIFIKKYVLLLGNPLVIEGFYLNAIQSCIFAAYIVHFQLFKLISI